jgi:drug/metabolite transporter (DMT)-like permease
MNAALWGLISAAGLGGADFMARYSARALGAPLAYAAVLIVGAAGLTAYMLAAGAPFIWSWQGNLLAATYGICVAVMCMLLYWGLARGPVAIVAPIVAAHPALVLIVNVMTGLRPEPLQWAGMLVVIAGGILIARSAEAHPQLKSEGAAEMHKTLTIAAGACLAYVVLILAGQAAAPAVGELQAATIGRWAGLLPIGLVLAVQRRAPAVPGPWIPFVLLQGVLDTVGYVAFLKGSTTEAAHVTMVVASTFSVITVLLARLILKEPIGLLQWAAIAMIATGTAVLAGSG